MERDWLASFDALMNVIEDGAWSNKAINQSLFKFKGANAGFVQTLVKGTVRYLLFLDHRIDLLAKHGIGSIRQRPLAVLRMAIYAIEKMDSVPDYAAVNEAVNLANKVCKGNSGFVNSVLRTYLRRKKELEEEAGHLSCSIRLSYPDRLAKMLLSQYPEDGMHVMESLNEVKPVCLRCNSMRIKRADLIDMLEAEGLECVQDNETESGIIVFGGAPSENTMFKGGYYSIQSSSSIEAVEHFAVKPGHRVLDLCAAPGGKSAAMAEMMRNTGIIDAFDIYDHRVDLINANCHRLGINIINTEVRDATVYYDDLDGRYDFVLADVPCSGIGVISGKPEIKYKIKQDNIRALREKQIKILKNAIGYAKRGGMVMYSTCTLNREENEGVVQEVIKAFEFVEIIEKKLILPYNYKVGFYFCIMRVT